MSETIRNVTVLGTGVLGAQIAFQTAWRGFHVTAWDIDDDALGRAGTRYAELARTYEAEVPQAAGGKADGVPASIALTTDLAAAAAAADLVIEAVPERLDLKRDLYVRLGEVAPAHAVFATNSSTLLPSALAASTGRPDRFLALHFGNHIWRFNIAEVMGSSLTDPAVFDRIIAFAGQIGMVPIPIRKEKAGYVLNSLLVPFLDAGLELAADGIAEPHDVDRTWRIATGAPLGPFQILDVIGLATPYNIMMNGNDRTRRIGAWLKENYIDPGRSFYDRG